MQKDNIALLKTNVNVDVYVCLIGNHITMNVGEVMCCVALTSLILAKQFVSY